MTEPATEQIQTLFERWQAGPAERSTAQSFIRERCGLPDLPEPEPTKPENSVNSENSHVRERSVTRVTTDGSLLPALEAPSARFGRKAKKPVESITDILGTLESLRQLEGQNLVIPVGG